MHLAQALWNAQYWTSERQEESHDAGQPDLIKVELVRIYQECLLVMKAVPTFVISNMICLLNIVRA